MSPPIHESASARSMSVSVDVPADAPVARVDNTGRFVPCSTFFELAQSLQRHASVQFSPLLKHSQYRLRQRVVLLQLHPCARPRDLRFLLSVQSWSTSVLCDDGLSRAFNGMDVTL